MRARNIKPGFFKNEVIAELPTETRLLFIGLWLLCDREGRLEDRPKRIKAELFAFDSFNVDSMLDDLQSDGFLIRYEVDEKKYIQVENFVKHQDPHYKEKRSEIPPIPGREDFIKATGITRAIKQRILERDNYTCQMCGAADSLCIDHIIPASRGGSSNDDNLQVLCISCNTKKGNKLAGEDKGCKKSKHDSGSVLVRSNVDPTLSQRNRSLPSDSLIPDSLNPDSGLLIAEGSPEPETVSKPSPVVSSIPIVGKGGGEGPVTQADVDEWQILFPAVDVMQEIRNIRAWNLANPSKRKTATGYKRHIVSWLSKEQNRGGQQRHGAQKPSVGSKIERAIANGQEWLAMQEVHQ